MEPWHASLQRLRFQLGVLRGKSWPLPASAMPVITAAAVHGGAVAVIHGRGVDAVFVFPAQARSGALSALIAGTASAPSASSSSTTGGFSWSCVHSPLKLFGFYCCKNLRISGAPTRSTRAVQHGTPPGRRHTIYAVAGCGWTHFGTNPNS